MSKKSVSIKDIAKLAGVSIATVSRVINRNGKVAPETEKKILQVMEENHYVPNLLAKGFRTQKFTTIGIIVPDISIEFFPHKARVRAGTLGQSIMLPGGLHMKSGKRSGFCGENFEPVEMTYGLRYNREGEKDFNTYGLHRQRTGVWKHQKGYGSY